jgi:putative DNA primase/helicase
MSYDFTNDSISAAFDTTISEVVPWDEAVLQEAAIAVAATNEPAAPVRRVVRTDMMYQLGETLFGIDGPAMLANGWSVYPQERTGARKPGRCYGEAIRPINGCHLDVELPTADDMNAWSHQCATLNTACMMGPASGHVFAVDVDVLDEAMCEEIVGIAYDTLGATPFRRTGRAPKTALIYRHAPDDVIASTSRRFEQCPDNGLEILGARKPLTFAGIHHVTGSYITWHEASPMRARPNLAPMVSSEQVATFLAAVHARFPFTSGGHTSSGGSIVVNEGTGLVAHGREELMRRIVYEQVESRRNAILSNGAIPWLEVDIVQAVVDAFAADAEMTGRWDSRYVPGEAASRVRACVAKLQRGELPASRAVQAATAVPVPASAVEGETEDRGFVPLGYDKGRFFFMSRLGQIRDFSEKEIVATSTLLALAPASYWLAAYPSKTGINSIAAADALIKESGIVGVFKPERIRGRGVYHDKGDATAIVHLGDRLIVGGETFSPSSYRSSAIYEVSSPLPMILGEPPMTAEEAEGLVRVCELLPLPEGQGRLLAGWLAIASVCGGLAWRPHAWITGEAGSGKSWCLDNVVKPVLGDLAVYVQSKTTEAGLRGELRLDARPVIFDEFEFQNAADRARGQQILDLARQASSEGGPDIVKGTQDGSSRRFRIRSSFLFSSINLGLDQAADVSRTLVIDFRPSPDHVERNARFAALKSQHLATFDQGFGGRLLARTVSLLPRLKDSAEVFAQSIARSGRTRRMGDTYGTPMAGLWHLSHDETATPEQAEAFLMQQPFMGDAMQVEDTAPEWRRALDHLMQIRFDTESDNGRRGSVMVGDALRQLAGGGGDATGFLDKTIARSLAQAGVKLERNEDAEGFHVLVSTSSTHIGSDFERTAWGKAWGSTIARATGATKPRKNARFGALTSKAVSVPFLVFVGGV